mgnify:CR=1 FL=1
MENPSVRPIHVVRPKARFQLKGRQPEADAVQAVRALIGAPPPGGHRRDLLIEHLHQLNDHYRGLPERMLVALAAEMNLPMAEVLEVASFYHHFDILKDGQTPPALTVRVCNGLSCALAGADDLLLRLPALLGRDDVRVISAPCIGRCEQAPAAHVGQQAQVNATAETLAAKVAETLRSEQNEHHPSVDGSLFAINRGLFRGWAYSAGAARSARRRRHPAPPQTSPRPPMKQ